AVSVPEGKSPKALVPLCDAPWELCMVASGGAPLVSLYRTGPTPEGRWLDRPVPADVLARQARAAPCAMTKDVSAAFVPELAGLIDRLELAAESPAPAPVRRPDATIQWQSPESNQPVRLGFEAVVPDVSATDGAAIRADLHALLFRGVL